MSSNNDMIYHMTSHEARNQSDTTHTRPVPPEFADLLTFADTLIGENPENFERTPEAAQRFLDKAAALDNQRLVENRSYAFGEVAEDFAVEMEKDHVREEAIEEIANDYVDKLQRDTARHEDAGPNITIDEVLAYSRRPAVIKKLLDKSYDQATPAEQLVADGLQYAHAVRDAEKTALMPDGKRPADFDIEQTKANALEAFMQSRTSVDILLGEVSSAASMLRAVLRRRHSYLTTGDGTYTIGDPVVPMPHPFMGTLATIHPDHLGLDTIARAGATQRFDTFLINFGALVSSDSEGVTQFDHSGRRAAEAGQPAIPEMPGVLHSQAVRCVALYLGKLIPNMNTVYLEAAVRADTRISERLLRQNYLDGES